MKMLQIRNVPDDVHRALKARAARESTTMSELVLQELPRLAYEPGAAELMARIRARSPAGGPPAAELLRSERETR